MASEAQLAARAKFKAAGQAGLQAYWARLRAEKAAAAEAVAVPVADKVADIPPVADIVADIPPAHVVMENPPPFNPGRLAVQSFGDHGLCYIQQTHLYTSTGKYIREVPPGQAYITTEEMERNNARDKAKWRAKTRSVAAMQKAADHGIPDKLADAHRENQIALAAERYAE